MKRKDRPMTDAECAREINRLRPEIHRLQDEIAAYRKRLGLKPGEPMFGFRGN